MYILAKVAGIIAEFNPFHNGHKYILDAAKENSDAVVCVMSGSFVQRGEPAILPKHIRAKAALLCGADLIVELPAPWSLARARDFAKGGIHLLKNCLAEKIVFGSECGDEKALISAVKAEENPLFSELLQEELKNGTTYAAARQRAVEKIDPDAAKLLSQPNNILATEYISAANSFNFYPEFKAIKRIGAEHDSELSDNGFASASKIREGFSQNNFEEFVPKEVTDIYKKALKDGTFCVNDRFDTSAAALLRFREQEFFPSLSDISEGLDNALYKACRSAHSLEDAAFKTKSKRYTLARIRRLLCLAALEIGSDIQEGLPPYIRVLGMSDKGAELIKEISKSSSFPIIIRPADAKKLTGYAASVFAAELRASDMQAFCFENSHPCGYELTKKVTKV